MNEGSGQGLTTSPKAWPQPFWDGCWIGGLTNGAPGLLVPLALSQALGVRAQTGFSRQRLRAHETVSVAKQRAGVRAEAHSPSAPLPW